MDYNDYLKLFSLLKNKKPLVHHITNNVTINDCANVTLAIGASPVMATSIQEVEDMVQIADSLVINIGTITEEIVQSIIKAGKAANGKGIPIIFDPVGVGATPYRKEVAELILKEVSLSIIRGNISEIYALIGGDSKTKGVDSGTVLMDQSQLTFQAAKQLSSVVVISGEVDTISDGKKVVEISNGDPLLPCITGTGCMLTSLTAAFAGCCDDYFASGILGSLVMGIAGERAKQSLHNNDGIGTFRVKLMDEIFNMNEQIVKEGAKIHAAQL